MATNLEPWGTAEDNVVSIPVDYYKVEPEVTALVRTVERGGYNRALTPMNQPVPRGDYEAPDWTRIPARTPKDEIRPVYNDKTGQLMYKSVSTGFVVRTLDKVFHGHNWGTEIVDFGEVPMKGGDIEYTCALQIVGPGMFRPALGVGSNVFRPSNPQDTKAKSIAGAITAALKNAAKTLNIGRDFDEDDPEVQKVVTERHKTIQLFMGKLDAKGMHGDVLAVIKKYAPLAVLGDNVMVTSIDFEQLETVQRELAELASKPTVSATSNKE